MTSRRVASLVTAMLLFSCAGGYQQSKEEVHGDDYSSPASATISPGRCRIIGTVISVSDIRTYDTSSPCSKEPCRASVRIDSVLGYGSGFAARLVQGNTVPMEFTFTMSPTTEQLFPNMDARYPGLTAGSAFRADVMAPQPVGGTDSDSAYLVLEYTKIR